MTKTVRQKICQTCQKKYAQRRFMSSNWSGLLSKMNVRIYIGKYARKNVGILGRIYVNVYVRIYVRRTIFSRINVKIYVRLHVRVYVRKGVKLCVRIIVELRTPAMP